MTETGWLVVAMAFVEVLALVVHRYLGWLDNVKTRQRLARFLRIMANVAAGKEGDGPVLEPETDTYKADLEAAMIAVFDRMKTELKADDAKRSAGTGRDP